MKMIHIRIEGTTPLLCNRFTEAAQQAATSGNRASSVGDPGTPREQAEASIHWHKLNGKKTPILPQPNIFACIIEGGRFFKAGKSKVTTQRSSLVPAAMSVEGLFFPIQSKEGWEVDTRPVRIPSTGGRILRHRAVFNDWAIEFDVSLDTDIISPKLMREIVDAAGKRIGLGDFRPSCKGPFGKFNVTRWEEK